MTKALRFLCALVVTAGIALPATAQTDAGSGGKNVVIATNQADGNAQGRSGLAVGRAAGPSALPENLASARSSCTDCRTVAAALQAVFVISDPDSISPRNFAAAVNAGCTRCETMAYAWQYVVSVGDPVTISASGEQQIGQIRQEIAQAVDSGVSFPDLEARLDSLASRFREVIDTESARVGGRGQAHKQVRKQLPTC